MRLFILLFCIIFLAGCSKDEKSAETSNNPATEIPATSQPADIQSLWQGGLEAFRKGITEDNLLGQLEGIDLLEQAVAAAPENRAIWVDLVDAYQASKNMLLVAQSIDICEALLKEETAQPDLLLERIAKGYRLLGNTPAALAIAQKRVEMAPEERLSRAVLDLSLLAAQVDDLKPVIACLQKRSLRCKNPAFLLINLAILYELNGQNDLAKTTLKKALSHLPADSPMARAVQKDIGRFGS